MKATILGCGYVGRSVAIAWEAQGITVTATTTRSERLSQLEAIASRAAIARGDDVAALSALLADQDVVLISVGAPQRTPDAYETTYLYTAQSLVSVLPKTSVRQVIYTGTCAVYGDWQGAWVDETTAIAPHSRTSELLAETERVLLDAASLEPTGRAVCVLRLGGIYGPGRELQRIFSRAAGKERPGEGMEPSNWVHLDDITGAIAFAVQRQLSGIFNLVQDNPPSRRELIDRVCSAHGLPSVQWNPNLPTQRSYNAKVSNQKLREAGYSFVHSDFEGI